MLWNDYYRPLPDGEHDFTDVQRLIWQTLVIKLLKDTVEGASHGEIVVKARGSLSSVLVGTESTTDRVVTWQLSQNRLEGQLLLFEDFFDFRNWDEPRDLQYVECWVTSPVKEHLLIPTNEVDFYYRAQPEG
jgi:hypothetical protein